LRLRRRLFPGHRLSRALTGSSIRMSSLTPHREISPMTQPTVGTEVHQAFDVERHLAPQVALDLVALVENRANSRDLVVRHGVRLLVSIDVRLGEYLTRRVPAHAVDVGERDLHALVSRKIDSCDSCHAFASSLSLAAACDAGSCTESALLPGGGSPCSPCRS